MSTIPTSATVTVELAEETLLALFGEKGRTTPPPLPSQITEGSPRLVSDLQHTPPILQSAQRPLFQAVTQNQAGEAESLPEEPADPAASEVTSFGVNSFGANLFGANSSDTVPVNEATTPAGADGLVLYQAPAPNRRATWLAGAGVAMALTGFATYAYTATRQPGNMAVVSPGAESFAKYSPLKLQLESREHSLVGIRWDPQSAPVDRADSGRLVILEDGSDARVVPLDVAQLKIGHLYYDTPADRVEFRLEVTGKDGAITKESLLALATSDGLAAAKQTADKGTPAPKPISRDSASTPIEVLSKPMQERAEQPAQSKPSARQFTPPAGEREAESLRAVYLEPPAETGTSPSLSVLAALPAFNHFAPPPATASPVIAAQKPPESWTAASLLRKVPPVYPATARATHLEGTVRFTATVSKDGKVKNLQTISGNPLLVPAASDAARQWLYRPTILNGKPVEALTQIAIDFTLK